MLVLENVISDRGSRYAVAGGPCADGAAAREFLRALRRDKRFARATHNSWALIGREGALKNDDGEAGAGMVILRELDREALSGHIVVVTRWFGGKHLGGDRFRHVREAVRIYLAARETAD
ncbi:YigZ family protein [Amaricoccus solimangrovi]|uniref:YigZ family protein n=1 Tax=Amaricoccus solimangrovi TaxID=2589815 RepID=A0A501WJH7_9RHOB|nr:YigZ family protein [Amaricoccus solimangrovi]TPE48932.1 YigZ family protein [Amaricoccus solimangrovi]